MKPIIKTGDLVKSIKHDAIGVVAEIFGDLDPKNPWVRVIFTERSPHSQWCRLNGLLLITKEKKN